MPWPRPSSFSSLLPIHVRFYDDGWACGRGRRSTVRARTVKEDEREIAWHMRVVGNLQERGRGAAAQDPSHARIGVAPSALPPDKTKGARQSPAKKNLFWADKSDGREVAASLP